jgi:hypothetical protein
MRYGPGSGSFAAFSGVLDEEEEGEDGDDAAPSARRLHGDSADAADEDADVALRFSGYSDASVEHPDAAHGTPDYDAAIGLATRIVTARSTGPPLGAWGRVADGSFSARSGGGLAFSARQ